MQNSHNYQKELEAILKSTEQKQKEGGTRPTLLLQCCCAPCSSYCLEYLREYFDITVLYYNPNIQDEEEYQKRKEEEIRLIGEYNKQVAEKDFTGMHSDERAGIIHVLDCDHDAEKFDEVAAGYETCPEGGERCTRCFALRLKETARRAKDGNFDFFSTTLTISPLKDAARINRIGQEMGKIYGVPFLPSDFKKKNGYQRSIELSRQFQLYRQNFCGCRYSKEEAEKKRRARTENQNPEIKIQE